MIVSVPPVIGKSHPELLSECSQNPEESLPKEPLDMTKPEVYSFVHQLYKEVDALFRPEQWIHIGGDEVNLDCWKHNKKIQQWLKDHNMTSGVQLLEYFEKDLVHFVSNKLWRRAIVWQDLFDSGVKLPNQTVIDVWKSWDVNTREKATEQSYDVLFSACWYLDHLKDDFRMFYQCDPRDFNGTNEQKAHIIGGHASMWAERVDENNFFPRVWPRTSAVAEKLWSGQTIPFRQPREQEAVEARLDRFRCLMVHQQGIPVSPVSPGTCERMM
jgi:hexosaminidase